MATYANRENTRMRRDKSFGVQNNEDCQILGTWGVSRSILARVFETYKLFIPLIIFLFLGKRGDNLTDTQSRWRWKTVL